DCGVDGVSAWAGPYSFRTTQIPATLDYEQDFEGVHSWAFTNNTSHANNWYVGDATGNPGSSLYISNDGGITNENTITGLRVVHAYREIAIPERTTLASISFDWKGMGEDNNSAYDYFRVWMVPSSYVPTAGTNTQISSGSGRIQIGGNFYRESEWVLYRNTNIDLSSFAGQTMRLVFEWRNDSGTGTGEAAAIDNINLSVITCFAPASIEVSDVDKYSATVTWQTPDL